MDLCSLEGHGAFALPGPGLVRENPVELARDSCCYGSYLPCQLWFGQAVAQQQSRVK